MLLNDTTRPLAAAACLFVFACSGSPPTSPPDAGLPDTGDGGPDDGGAGDGGTDDGGPDGGGAGDGGIGGGPYDAGPLPGCETAWNGDRQFGSALADEALALVAAPGDVLLAGGYEQGVLGGSVDPTGPARGFVQRYLADGTEAEKRLFQAGTTVEALAVRGDDALAVGRTAGKMGSWAPAGMYDAFLARAPLDGSAPEPLWVGGTERPEHPRSVSLDPGGQLFAAGWTDIYIPTNYVERWEDELTFSLRLSAAGAEPLWLRTGTLDVTDRATSIAADPLSPGGYAVSGLVDAGAATRGPWVRLVDPAGAVIWSRRLTTVGPDSAGGVAFAPDGHVIVAGSTFTTIFGKPWGQQDVFVAKLDRQTGDTLWSLQYGSAESDWVTSIAVDWRGTIAVGGETAGDVTGKTPNAGDYDVFALLVSSGGELLGTWQAGSVADDRLHAIAFDRCSRVFAAGATAGALFGPPLGDRDAWVAQVRF